MIFMAIALINYKITSFFDIPINLEIVDRLQRNILTTEQYMEVELHVCS